MQCLSVTGYNLIKNKIIVGIKAKATLPSDTGTSHQSRAMNGIEVHQGLMHIQDTKATIPFSETVIYTRLKLERLSYEKDVDSLPAVGIRRDWRSPDNR